MNRLLRGARWLMGTQWPMYATLVLGSNILGAVAIMTFVVFLLPMPEIKDFTSDVPHLALIGVLYVSFAVLIGISVTLLLFRPVLDWQRNPEAHDPNMVRNLVLRIPIYQAAVAGLVWIIGIVLAIIIAAQSSGSLGQGRGNSHD